MRYTFGDIFSLMHRIGSMDEYTYNNLLTENISLLNEAMTIDKARQTFSTIPQDVLQTLITIDPTYKGDNNVGKLFTWIANSYLRDSSIVNNPELSKQILTIFKDNQNRFTQQTNIKQFQSIEQLKQFLAQQGMLEQNNNDEIANSIDNAEVRNGTKVVLNGKNWLIIVPTNYAADRHWGADTSWCTAADNDGYYYDYYLEHDGGQYYILINKNDEYEKYQFHFESNQFMNAEDQQIGQGVYDLVGYDELNSFFTKERGEGWAEQVAEQDETEEQWEIEDRFSSYPTINICHNNENGMYALKNDYGEDVYDGMFDEIEPISDETGCAKFEDDNSLYGLLYLKQGQRGGETVEKYVEGFASISDWDYLSNGDDDNWFYIGKASNGSCKLITNYPETMQVDYNEILIKSKAHDDVVLVVETDDGIGIMENGFKIEQRLEGEYILDAPSKNWVIIRRKRGEGSYMYNVDSQRVVEVPLEGRVGVIGTWMIGYVNGTKNAFDLNNGSFLFGQPLQGNADFIVDTQRSKNNPQFKFMTQPEIIYDTWSGAFYQENTKRYDPQQDRYRKISKEEAYQLIQSNA